MYYIPFIFALIVLLACIAAIIITGRKNRVFLNEKFTSPEWRRGIKLFAIFVTVLLAVTAIITVILNVVFDFSPFCYFWGFWVDLMIANPIFLALNANVNRKIQKKHTNTASPSDDSIYEG